MRHIGKGLLQCSFALMAVVGSGLMLSSMPACGGQNTNEPNCIAGLNCPSNDGGNPIDHNKPPPEGSLQDCVVYPNGVAFDIVDYTCKDPAWQPGSCADPTITNKAASSAAHLCLPNPISYPDSPPSGGTHRGEWGKWGEYTYIPPQRWLHNLEHGGVAFLYHPCAPKAMIEELRQLAKSQPKDDAGEFRYILTPYVNLPTAIAVVAWEWTYTAQCVNKDKIAAFIQQHYRKAPEDVESDGIYSHLWLSR